MSTLLESAIRYADLGYPVFPCVPGDKVPLTIHGFLDASTDRTQIGEWWTRYPGANIGTPTKDRLVVDIDGEDNSWPGHPTKAQDLARTPTSLTPHGGRHHLFRQPEGKAWKCTAGKIAPQVDTRANGGYIVLPPSVVDGIAYQWSDGSDLTLRPQELPEPPDWLAMLLDVVVSPPAGGPAGDSNDIPSGQRNATLARLAGAMRRVGMSWEEIAAALARVNTDRCQPPLPGREVRRIATSICRYQPDQVTVAVVEGHWLQDADLRLPSDDAGDAISDPGPLPVELLRVPGFVSEVMDYCLATAPYPNVAMAFAGALALQAVLAGRKVRDPGDNRTNLYLLGLAHSAAGKDHPRRLNTGILHAVGLSGQLGGRFASGEGVQDALFLEPCMLFQTDEIDGMLQSINKSREARHENVMGTLLTMYSSAASVFPMRRKAGREAPTSIDQPCLIVFGTAIPNHYYEALSERMLTNGFFARMIILECGKRAAGQEPRVVPVPERVLRTAKWWAEFRPGPGNLETWHPVPRIVPQSDEARDVLVRTRLEAEAEYGKAEAASDAVSTAVWGRVSENARKLALVYAVSESHEQPLIGRTAADWACRFAMHQARRMLFMAGCHVADNPFHAECLKVLQKLQGAPGGELAHSVLLKRMKIDAKTFLAVMTTLEQRGDVVARTESTRGAPGRYYRCVGQKSVKEVVEAPEGETR